MQEENILKKPKKSINVKYNVNEPLDRLKITLEAKLKLIQMLKVYPETRIVAEILIGKKELDDLIKEDLI